ncbi:hypothetical protein SNEBB_008331 [Seison nebaliae]|nr:hypothetical protein SNEBB_008331 [Seison nebaliae]
MLRNNFIRNSYRNAVSCINNRPSHYRLTTINAHRSVSSQSNGDCIKYEIKKNVGVFTFDNPESKVNILSRKMMEEFQAKYKVAQNDESVKAIVFRSNKYNCFFAGADVSMLKSESKKGENAIFQISRQGQEMFNEMTASKKPLVSAISGQCLGGGFEFSLATHMRIAINTPKTVFSFPEVMIGLLPGAGGLNRLTKAIPLPQALDLFLTGKQVQAKKAKSMGIVDLVVEPICPGELSAEETTLNYLEKVAIDQALTLVANGQFGVNNTGMNKKKKRGIFQKLQNSFMEWQYMRNFIMKKAKSQVMKTTGGLYPAPLEILSTLNKILDTPGALCHQNGWEMEAKGFAKLSQTTECAALISLYEGSVQCKKNQVGKPKTSVNNIGILGAGLMGAGIGEVSVDKANCRVVLKDVSTKSLARGYTQISSHLSKKVKRRKMRNIEKIHKLENLEMTKENEKLKKTELIIEAVFEDLPLKHKVIKEIEEITSPNTIIASNTSALPIADVARGSKRPENIIGMHYFSPVEKMQLLEIITHSTTSKEALSVAVDVGLRQGKLVIIVKDAPGFYTTRILSGMMMEAIRLIMEGVSPLDVDKATKKFGFPVGAATLMDEVGLDVAAHISVFLEKAFPLRFRVENGAELMKELLDNQNLGRKSGKGIFVYQKGSRGMKPVDEKTKELLEKYRCEPIMKQTFENCQKRLVTRFTNEAILCLEEEIIRNPVDGDIGAVFGLGFPPMKGGPFRYIDTIGADNFLKEINELNESMAIGNEFMKPSQMLVDYAKSGKKFHLLN